MELPRAAPVKPSPTSDQPISRTTRRTEPHNQSERGTMTALKIPPTDASEIEYCRRPYAERALSPAGGHPMPPRALQEDRRPLSGRPGPAAARLWLGVPPS